MLRQGKRVISVKRRFSSHANIHYTPDKRWENNTVEEVIFAMRRERIKSVTGVSQLPNFTPKHVEGDQVDDDEYIIYCTFDGADHYVLPNEFSFNIGLPIIRGLLLDDLKAVDQLCKAFLEVYRPSAIRGEMTVRLCPYEDGEGNEHFVDYSGQVGDWFDEFSQLSLPARLGWRPNRFKTIDWQKGLATIVIQFANDMQPETTHSQDVTPACDVSFQMRWEHFLRLNDRAQFLRFIKDLSRKLCREIRTSGGYLIPSPESESERQDWEMFDEDYD